MRVTRLYMQNYRVYEDPVEVELPPGLVGIYGLNGSGKSTLLESIRWTLFGRARTSIDLVRTADVTAECITEVEFEHEGHLYVVRRTISGANATVKAAAHADGMQVAEGARDTARYVHSVLGMDDTSFRASVFAEQKQLAALSQQRPEERRKLVLQLLGITPVDAARDRARKEAREAQQHVERLRGVLPDLDAARAEAEECRRAAEAATDDVSMAEKAAEAIQAERQRAEAHHDQLDAHRQEHELVAAELSTVRAEYERATARAKEREIELAQLDQAAEQLARLAPEAVRCVPAEKRLRAIEAVAAAYQAVTDAAVADPPPPPDENAFEAARAVAQEARSQLSEIDGLLRAARAERERAAEAVGRSSALSQEADCPLCGQALGTAFEQVQAHRRAELTEVEGRVAQLTAERRRLVTATEEATRAEGARAEEMRTARAAWTAWERARARREEAERGLERARISLMRATVGADGRGGTGGPGPGPERDGRRQPEEIRPENAALLVRSVAAEVARLRRVAEEVERLRGRLERRGRVEADLEGERLAVAANQGRLDTLAEKLVGIAFSPDALRAARTLRDKLREEADAVQRRLQGARLAEAQARSGAEAAARRVEETEVLHARLSQAADDARHLGRLAELLSAFRNNLVASVGPRLSVQAGELFAELTDHEYDALEVDPESYEIRVRDRGRLYGMDRFSGSEIDMANLALRVAISEHVQFQSGGTVGLLVLDEVFGPLDDERKERMLLALERLRARFRQVLVVTHDAAIKEQLANAFEVVKLPGRRASVKSLTS